MPVRIYEISKKLGIENKEVLAKAKELGITAARVPSSSLDKITAEFLESHLKPAAPVAPPPPPPAPPTPVVIAAPPVPEPVAPVVVEPEPPPLAPEAPAITTPDPAEVVEAKAPPPIEEPPAPPPPPPIPAGPKVGDKVGFIQLPTKPAPRA